MSIFRKKFNTQIIYFQSQIFQLSFTFLQSTGFKSFKNFLNFLVIMRGNDALFCSKCIACYPASHLNHIWNLNGPMIQTEVFNGKGNNILLFFYLCPPSFWKIWKKYLEQLSSKSKICKVSPLLTPTIWSSW